MCLCIYTVLSEIPTAYHFNFFLFTYSICICSTQPIVIVYLDDDDDDDIDNHSTYVLYAYMVYTLKYTV